MYCIISNYTINFFIANVHITRKGQFVFFFLFNKKTYVKNTEIWIVRKNAKVRRIEVCASACIITASIHVWRMQYQICSTKSKSCIKDISSTYLFYSKVRFAYPWISGLGSWRVDGRSSRTPPRSVCTRRGGSLSIFGTKRPSK